MKTYSLTSVIWQEEDIYVSKCPELGVASCGDTLEEAQENLKEAVELYLENAKELGMLDDLDLALKAHHKFSSTIEVSA